MIHSYCDEADFGEIVGKVVDRIEYDKDDDAITFSFKDGSRYLMYHDQDCCETVEVEEIIGSTLEEFAGETILLAEVVSNSYDPPIDDGYYKPDSYTWTFYKLASNRCNATIRWYGFSNGYYSESVDFVRLGGGQ